MCKCLQINWLNFKINYKRNYLLNKSWPFLKSSICWHCVVLLGIHIFSIWPCTNKLKRDKTLEMIPQAERHWALCGPVFQSVALQSERFHHPQRLSEAVMKKETRNHTFLSIYHTLVLDYQHQPPPLCPDTIALDKIPMPACQVLMPAPQCHPPLQAHLAHLSLWQCPLLLPQLCLSWQGACYMLVLSTGAVLSSIMSQTSLGTWDSQKGDVYRERMSEGKGNYALTSFSLSFLGLSHPPCPKITLEMASLLSFCWHSQLLLNWFVGGETDTHRRPQHSMWYVLFNQKQMSISSKMKPTNDESGTSHYLPAVLPQQQTIRKCKSAPVQERGQMCFHQLSISHPINSLIGLRWDFKRDKVGRRESWINGDKGRGSVRTKAKWALYGRIIRPQCLCCFGSGLK